MAVPDSATNAVSGPRFATCCTSAAGFKFGVPTAGSTCDFTPNGEQLGRGMGQWINQGGKSVFVEYAKP
jgi:hypothetical protein